MSCFEPVTTGKPAHGEQSQHPARGREGHGLCVCSIGAGGSELSAAWPWSGEAVPQVREEAGAGKGEPQSSIAPVCSWLAPW